MNGNHSEWVKKADEDLKSVEILMKDEEFSPSIVCFHCQQCAEKYLKAYLVSKNIVFPKIHDLVDLIEEYCNPQNSEFSELKEDAITLRVYAVTPRYPGDFYEASQSDAKEAYQATLKIKDFVMSKLK